MLPDLFIYRLIFDQAHKEEKKERLRQEIEETKRKEQDKTNAYIECVKKKEKKY